MSDFQYFDIQPLLSRGALLNFVISSRGAGKTYSAKEHILRRYDKNDEKFCFLKRRETEIDATKERFWEDMSTDKRLFRHHKGGHQIGSKEITYDDEDNEVEEITWRDFGVSTALSMTAKLKGMSPQNVRTILWDEFVAYDGTYLPDEATRLMDVIETFGRMRDDIQLIATGNKNEDGFYPIFHELGLSKTSDFEDNKVYSFKGGQILVYSFTNDAYIKAKSKTKLGKIAKGTNYYEKMVKNENESVFSELVIDKPKRTRPIFSVVVDGTVYEMMFASVGKHPKALYCRENSKAIGKRYSLDKSVLTVPRLAGNGYNLLYGYLTSGRMYFDSQVTAQKIVNAVAKKK